MQVACCNNNNNSNNDSDDDDDKDNDNGDGDGIFLILIEALFSIDGYLIDSEKVFVETLSSFNFNIMQISRFSVFFLFQNHKVYHTFVMVRLGHM